MIKLKTVTPLFIAVIWACALSGAEAIRLNIIEETLSSLQLEIDLPDQFEWRAADRYPQFESTMILGESSSERLSNRFYIPYFEWKIALPDTVKPEIRIISSQFRTYQLSRSINPADMHLINQRPLAAVTEVGFQRDIPTGILRIYPLRASLSAREMQILSKIEIRLIIRNSDSQGKLSNPPSPNAVHLNARSASVWRRPLSKRVSKAALPPTGKWLKLSVASDGLYYLTAQDVEAAGISAANLDTNCLFIFSNATGGREQSATPGLEVPINLVENSRLILGNRDRYFEIGDTLIFYGRATSGVEANSQGRLYFNRNAYAKTNFYWLLIADTPGTPKSMLLFPSQSTTPTATANSTECLERHEQELVNFLHSGKSWYGEKFAGSGSNVTLLKNMPTSQSSNYPTMLTIKVRGATSDNVSHSYKLYINSSSEAIANWSSSEFYSATRSVSTNLRPGPNLLRINYTASQSAANAYLDYIDFSFTSPLDAGSLPFRFWAPSGNGNYRFQIRQIGTSRPLIFDITDFASVAVQNYSINSDSASFTRTIESSHRLQFLIVARSDFQKPDKIESLAPEWNLIRDPGNGAQYVIITNESLLPTAQSLADLYSNELRPADRLSTKVVTQNQILREFTGDVTDPHAIRYFLKYALTNWVVPPEYVLLFGDGTYDYRGLESTTGNLVMTYQIEPDYESGDGYSSYVSDARFVYLMGTDRLMDMAIGRLNVRNLAEANAVTQKIRQYLTEPEYGDWRSKVTLVADDPQRPLNDEQYHLSDTENYLVKYLAKSLVVNKLYLLEYPEVQDASSYGVKKPAATEAILKQLETGTTIINYLGHGSPSVWAQEYVLVKDRDIGKIKTGGKLPFWIAGTCSWGQFDEINTECMPEALIRKAADGGIAALAGSRPTYGSANRAFISQLFQRWFANGKINRYRLGNLIMSIFNGQNENTEKYILFSDPALYLALPYEFSSLDKMPSDTLPAMTNVLVTGTISTDTDRFDGNGILTVFDSQRFVTRYYLNDDKVKRSMSYFLPGEVLFRGNIQVINNEYTGRFYVPKDLNYEKYYGQIKFYGYNPANGQEAGGHYDSLVYTGSSPLIDTVGPEIRIGFKNQNFVSGDPVTPSAILNIEFRDAHGINIAGQIGHDITLNFDNDALNLYNLTSDFIYHTNSDSSGLIERKLPELEPGKHSVTVKAWDNANNPTSVSADFILLASDKFKLEKVYNYPNPFKHNTDFTFYLTQPAKIKLTIYTVRGLVIKTIDPGQTFDTGFNQINWNGEDEFGDPIGHGIYLYRISAIAELSRQKDQFIGKLVRIE